MQQTNTALTNYLLCSEISKPLLSLSLCMHMNYQRHLSLVLPYSMLLLDSNNHAEGESFRLVNVSANRIIDILSMN